MTADEIALLERAALDKTITLQIVVTTAAYSCCGRGWEHRTGHEQTYRGWVDNLIPAEGEACGSFMLYSAGLGTLSYVVAVLFPDVELLEQGI